VPPSLAGYWQQLRKPLELELARACPDTAVAGASIGVYARLWAQRLQGGSEDDARLAQSIARGLRDYPSMPVAERRRRAMAAIDLLNGREHTPPPLVLPTRPPAKKRTPPTAPSKPRETPPLPLPVGHELLEMPIEQLAPRAKWPKLLAVKLGLETVRDLLYHIPRDWVEITAIDAAEDGMRAAFVGTVVRREYDRLHSRTAPHPLYKYTLTITDDTGEAWVSAITMEPARAGGQRPSWSPNKLLFRPEQRVFALGKVDRTGKIIELQMEDIFEVSAAEAAELQPGAKVPIYPLTNGVFQSQVHRAVLRVLAALNTSASANAIMDSLPLNIREEYGLLPLLDALQELHRPSTSTRHELARKRLAFEEFLIPQLILARRRWEQHHTQEAPAFAARESLPDLVARLVPFEPTPAQVRVLAEIEDDLRSPRPMHRLLQGDVGSGKTLVAAGALAFAVRSGQQAAIMAPTEILAEQLFIVLSHLLTPLAMRPVLLTGSLPPAERRAALQAIASGAAHIAVGTHALIQDGVVFHNLGLTIVDEQHRFGVRQRATLRNKGLTPNALIMTATPIPRTLSLTAYGDLDTSVLDGMPPGRHPVETRWLPTEALPEAYRFLRTQISAGRQAYVLCPLVEQSEMLQADAAIDMAEELRRRFPDFQVGLLHGRMRPEEKDAAMQAFRSGDTHILACTTVVEVGVDVPNATVMLIHNAERFGLAQLHQLRGRVGRSSHQSHCLLVTHPRFNPTVQDTEELPARKRLRIMLQEQDGFAIAEADLEIRGPGEYLGTRQSGLVDFSIGSLVRDGAYLEQAHAAAHAIIADDPSLASPAHAELRRRVQRLKSHVDAV
jgi:ATP-dependent DNA helicase RecG